MKTKHILYLYLSLLLGFCTTEFIDCNFWTVYISATLIYWVAVCSADHIAQKAGKPLLSTEKRIRQSKREVGGDIARTIAVILVPVVHFFGLTYYYSTNFTADMIFPTAIRWLGICAVPLFMIISGYFKSNAKISFKHYFGIIPLLLTHIFICSIRIWVDKHLHGEVIDMQYVLDRLVYFKYGWYIRLYIGMLLLMPFFNAGYKAIDSKWKKEIIILTLVGLNALGPITFDVIPSSWLAIYVFGYYIIGCYLREYKVKLNPMLGISALCGILLIISTATYFHCKGSIFDWGFIGYQSNSAYSAMCTVFISAIIMVLCLNIDFEIKPVNFIFKAISMVSLEMYLFSQMFDGFIYKEIIENNVPFAQSFKHIVILAGSSALLAFIASWIKKAIFLIRYLFIRRTYMNRTTKGILFTVLGGIFWGLSGNFGQYLFESKELNANWLVTIRLLSAGIIMLFVTLLKKENRKNIKEVFNNKRNVFEIIVFSILGMLGCQLSYYLTIEYSNASTAIVLQYTAPVIIMLYLALRNKKFPVKSEIISLILVVAGTFFLATHGNIHSLAISHKALVFGLTSAVTVVFYNLVPVRLMNKYGTLMILGLGMFIGGVTLSIFTKPWIVPGIWDCKTFIAFGFLVLMGTVFAFSAYLYGVRLIGAGKASLFAATEPLTSILVAVCFMGQKMIGMDVGGIVCIILGVGILSMINKK